MSYLRIALVASLLLASEALAGNLHREALVTRMYQVQCNPTGFMATMAGPSPGLSATCSEYVIVSETVEYRIRPHKNQVLLPVGEPVRFAFSKSHLLVRPDDADQDYEFDVISMELYDSGAAIAAAKRRHGSAH